MTTVTFSLSDLINLSFGNFELRNMKFRVLHWCLQVMAIQLKLDDTKVEFKGSDSLFIQNEVSSADEQVRNKIIMTVKKEKNVFGLTRRTATVPAEEPPLSPKGMSKVVVIDQGEIVSFFGQKESETPPTLAAMSRFEAKLRTMQSQVDDIGTKILPNDKILLDRMRQSQESTPVTELLHTMKITKRLTGAEEEIDRLASLLETVAKEYSEIKTIMSEIQQEFGEDINETLHQLRVVSRYIRNIRPREAYFHITLQKRLRNRKASKASIEMSKPKYQSGEDFDEQSVSKTPKSSEEMTDNDDDMDDIEGDEDSEDAGSESEIFLSNIYNKNMPKKKKTKELPMLEANEEEKYFEVLEPLPEMKTSEHNMKTINKLIHQHEQLKLDSEFLAVQVNTLADFAEVVLSELSANKPNVEVLRERVREIHLRPSEYKKTKCLKRDILNMHTETCYRINSIEGKVSKYAAKIQLQDDLHEHSITSISTRIETLEKDMDIVLKDVDVIKSIDHKDKEEILERLGEHLAKLEESTDAVHRRTSSLSKDVKSHEILIKKLNDDIFAVKSVKLDRFEFDDLLSDKASIVQLNTKLSNDDFTQAYRFLMKSIENTSEKISTQSLLWQRLTDNMQEAIQNKLSLEDFHELTKNLFAELKKMKKDLVDTVFAKYGPPARGGKLKYMTNLQCISCDREVLMKVENVFPSLPILSRLTPHLVKKGIPGNGNTNGQTTKKKSI